MGTSLLDFLCLCKQADAALQVSWLNTIETYQELLEKD